MIVRKDDFIDHPKTPENSSSGRYTTVVVDPCRLFREGLISILQSTCFNTVEATATIEDAQAQIGRGEGMAIDLLICSLDTERSIGLQLDAIRAIRRRDASTKVVMLMPTCSAEDLIAAVLCGADGVILKDISGDKLTAALDLVMHGQHVLPLGVALQVFSGRLPAVRTDDQDQQGRLRGYAAGTQVQGTMAAAIEPLEQGAGRSVFKAGDVAGTREKIPQDAARQLGLSDREKQILQCLVEGFANKMIARRLEIAEATVKVHIKGLLRKINVSNRTQAAIWALNQSVAVRPQSCQPLGPEMESAERLTKFGQASPARPEKSLLPDMIAVFPASPGSLPCHVPHQKHA